jgi:DNA end-binding protein Ku
MHGRDHIALIRAGREAILLHTLYYAHEIGRAPYRIEPGETVRPKELELAKMLIAALENPFAPEKWQDQYEQRLQTMVASRAPVPGENAELPDRKPPVPDIRQALRQSIELARKPAARESRPPKPPRTRNK